MLVKKYYDGEQIHRIISEEVKDYDTIMKILKRFADEPSAQPAQLGTNLAEAGADMISRRAAIDAANALIDRFERILRDIRESREDDTVCGMCEYDGAFIGQSGDWCNECPGFDKADCFKLSDTRRGKWLSEITLPTAPPTSRREWYQKGYKDGQAAQPMRKKGRWRRRLVDSGFNADWHCSECGWKTAIEEHGYNYCPNCGADMRGEIDG